MRTKERKADAALSNPPGELLRSIREELGLKQWQFGRPGAEVGVTLHQSVVSDAEHWGVSNGKKHRPVTESLIEDWWKCCDYWWRKKRGTPPPLTKRELLAKLHGIEANIRRGRSSGKRLLTVRFFGDSGSHSETKEGIVSAAALFGLDYIGDFACGGNAETFIDKCGQVAELAQGGGFHMLLVELPPDKGYLPKCCDALMNLVRRGEDGFLKGTGFVTVVLGLSTLHEGLCGTMDARSETARYLADVVVGLGQEHIEKTGGSVRVLTLTGGAACMAYDRNAALVPLLRATFGDAAVMTECVHPSEADKLRHVVERHTPRGGSGEKLIIVPLYFGGTRLVADLVPDLDDRFAVVSTDVCQDFVRRIAIPRHRWVATVATDLWQVGFLATAYAERLSLAASKLIEWPSKQPLTLPVVTVRREVLHEQKPIDELRHELFIPALKSWAETHTVHPWASAVVKEQFFPLQPRD